MWRLLQAVAQLRRVRGSLGILGLPSSPFFPHRHKIYKAPGLHSSIPRGAVRPSSSLIFQNIRQHLTTDASHSQHCWNTGFKKPDRNILSGFVLSASGKQDVSSPRTHEVFSFAC